MMGDSDVVMAMVGNCVNDSSNIIARLYRKNVPFVSISSSEGVCGHFAVAGETGPSGFLPTQE